MTFAQQTLAALTALALAILGACSSSPTPASKQVKHAPTAMQVEHAPEDSYVIVSGKVARTGPGTFLLDYGDGHITVEMDDWDMYDESRHVLEDDFVTVYGYVDDGFYERRSLEASSVYIENLGVQYFASGMDEEDFPTVTGMDPDPFIEVRGTVKAISGDKFELSTNSGTITVDTDELGHDPLDDEGFLQLSPGDKVRVTGALEAQLFSSLELEARTIIKLEYATSEEGGTG